MAGISSAIIGKPQVAFLFEEVDPTSKLALQQRVTNASTNGSSTTIRFTTGQTFSGGSFVFQYWPTQVQDSYDVEYATKMIPGGSHPIYQWVSGNGRTVSFEALFTSEVSDTGLPNILLPSARYTVDIAAAIATLKSFQYPLYDKTGKGYVTPPPRLRLVFPGSNIGGNTDGILCYLKAARVTYESFFNNGQPRVAMVALEFVETVQNVAADKGSSKVQFLDRSIFFEAADKYKYTPT